MEATKTEGQEEKKMAHGTGPGGHSSGTKSGVYVNLRGRFAGQQDRVQARLTGAPRKVPARMADGKEGRHGRDTGRKPQARQDRARNRGFRSSVRHSRPMYDGEEEYSSTCCGKCRYFLRQWRGGVWVCGNGEGEKSGLPVNYAGTCPLFAHEDWSRDEQGQHKAHRN